MLKVMIVDEAVERAEVLQQALTRAGYEVIAYVPSTFDLHRQVAALKPDIVIIDTDSPDRDTLENLCVVTPRRSASRRHVHPRRRQRENPRRHAGRRERVRGRRNVRASASARSSTPRSPVSSSFRH